MSCFTLRKKFHFEAAHRLPLLPDTHKCSRMHGHSFCIFVEISSSKLSDKGWVLDYGEISKVVDPIIKELDHYCLNEIQGLENPTSENLAKWLWDRIKIKLPLLSLIEVSETCSSNCRYQGDGYSLVLTTVGKKEDAEKIAEKLLKKNLSACVSFFELTSNYLWKGKMTKEGEFLLLIKTRTPLYPLLEKEICSCHPYELPEILRFDASEGLPEYLHWIDARTEDEKS